MVLGIMEIINIPVRILFFIIPIGIYALGLYFRDYLEVPFIPDNMKNGYNMLINGLLLMLFISLVLLTLLLLGQSTYESETKVFREALNGRKETKKNIHLVYKRRKNGVIERRIYSHTLSEEWNDRAVCLKILKVFDEHFKSDKFVTDNKNSRVTIMKTVEGFTLPQKENYHDEALDKEMDEI